MKSQCNYLPVSEEGAMVAYMPTVFLYEIRMQLLFLMNEFAMPTALFYEIIIYDVTM